MLTYKYNPKGGIYMKAIGRLFSGLFNTATSDALKVYHQWDRMRAEALTPSHRSEIDAIFARHL